MSADINTISTTNTLKPLVQYSYADDISPKPIIQENPSFDPYKDIVQSHAQFVTNKKITIYLDEDNVNEDEFVIVEKRPKLDSYQTQCRETKSPPCESILRRCKSIIHKDHVVTFTCSDSDCEFSTTETKSSQTSTPPSDESDTSTNSTSTVTASHPSEIGKTILAAIILGATFFINLVALSIVHDKVPKRSDGPLPDIVLSVTDAYEDGLFISEYIIMFTLFSSVTSILLFHRYSSIVLRRAFLMLSVLYFYRTITMSVTILPTASKNYKCAPKITHPEYFDIVRRTISLIPNFGLSVIGPQQFCGDLIYSGHTVLLVLIALLMSEYTSKSLWLVHWIYRGLALLGILMLELSHSHYLIDVVIAYYITTRVFWTYQTYANIESLKSIDKNNCYNRSWWFKIFLFFEKNVHGPVPNECQWLFDYEERESSKLSIYGSI